MRLPPLDELVEHWPVIARHLERATRRTGCYEPIDILRLAFLGQVGVWTCEIEGVIVAALVSEVKQYPRKRVLEMLFAGGNRMAIWIDAAVDALDQHAEQTGCDHIAALGRPGWARAWGGRLTGDVVSVRSLKD